MKKTLLACLLTVCTFSLFSCKQQNPTQDNLVQDASEVQDTKTPEELEKERLAREKADQEKQQLSKPYNETENAQEKLDQLIDLAKENGQYVFVQAGGNWCIWCLRFNDFVQDNPQLKAIVDKNYQYYHLNYSPKNKNQEVFDKYVPQAKGLGYPFFFIINPQNSQVKVFTSGDLEQGKSYSLEKVTQLFVENAPSK
ncbi:thioredoxin family protein [Myroides sp. LJL119]